MITSVQGSRLASLCSLKYQELRSPRASGRDTRAKGLRLQTWKISFSFFTQGSVEKLPWKSRSSAFSFLNRRAGQEGADLSGAWRLCFQLRKVILNPSILAKPDGSPGLQPLQPRTHAVHLDLRCTCLQITPIFCLVQQRPFPLPPDVIRPSEFTCAYYELSCVLSWCLVSVAVITYIYIKIWYQLFG